MNMSLCSLAGTWKQMNLSPSAKLPFGGSWSFSNSYSFSRVSSTLRHWKLQHRNGYMLDMFVLSCLLSSWYNFSSRVILDFSVCAEQVGSGRSTVSLRETVRRYSVELLDSGQLVYWVSHWMVERCREQSAKWLSLHHVLQWQLGDQKCYRGTDRTGKTLSVLW